MQTMNPTTTTTIETARWISEHDPLPVITYDHSGVEGIGFDPRSAYVETYWLAVLGPSSVLAARRIADWLEDQRSGIVVDLEDLACSLGLGHGTGRHAPVVRTLDRLVMFGLAQIAWDAYALRSTIPPLSPRQIRRLPRCLAERHDDDLRSMGTVTVSPAGVVPLSSEESDRDPDGRGSRTGSLPADGMESKRPSAGTPTSTTRCAAR